MKNKKIAKKMIKAGTDALFLSESEIFSTFAEKRVEGIVKQVFSAMLAAKEQQDC